MNICFEEIPSLKASGRALVCSQKADMEGNRASQNKRIQLIDCTAAGMNSVQAIPRNLIEINRT